MSFLLLSQTTRLLNIFSSPHLHVISIDHKDRKALTFRRSFTQDFKFSPRFYYEGAFLHEDVAGFVGFKLDDNQCVIQAFNLTTRESLRIKTRIDRVSLSFHYHIAALISETAPRII